MKRSKNRTNDLTTLHIQENLRDAADFTSIDQRIILMWKMDKYSVKSISIKAWMDSGLVNKNISKYKREVLNLSKINKNKNSKKKKMVADLHINFIRDFWNSLSNQPITIRKIKAQLHNPILESEKISQSLIQNILLSDLKWSTKFCINDIKKIMKKESARIFAESLSIQLKLMTSNFEIIYMDEFSFSSRK